MSDGKRVARGTLLGPTLVFGLSCLVFVATTRLISLPPAWATFEFCQYAEIGGNLAEEGAFDTRLVEPMALAYLDRNHVGQAPGQVRWPVVNRYPLPCLVIALLFKAFGATNEAAAWSNGLAIGGLAALAAWLARRWYGRGWGAFAALLILANPAFYGYFVLLGTPDIWFALLFDLELLAFTRLLSITEKESAAAALTGVFVGLSFLTRFNVSLFLIPQIFVLLARHRLRATGILSMVAAAIVAPMIVYNLRHFGRPLVSIYSAWNLLDDIGAYQIEPWLYYRIPETGREVWAHLHGFANKFVVNLTQVVPLRVWSLWHFDLILPLAIAGFAFLKRRRTGVRDGRQEEGSRFLTWSLMLFGLQLVVFSSMRLELEDRQSPHHGRYFFWFAVPVLLLAIGFLRNLTRWHRAFHVATAIVVLTQLAIFGSTWQSWIEQNRGGTNLGRDPIRKMLAELVPVGHVIASNQPQWTAWYGKKLSVSLPADPDEIVKMNRLSPTPLDYLFIDLNANFIDLDPRWTTLVSPGRDGSSAWESSVLIDYEYVLSPQQTRPVRYVVLRRRAVPPSRLERTWRQGHR